MATAANVTETFGVTGTDEQTTMEPDVVDKIFDISPTETPFASGIGSNKATSTTHQWIEDSLTAAASNPVIQGSNVDDVAAQVGARSQNFTQIFRGVVTVSETMQAVSQYGIQKMASYLAAKVTKEMKRDIEFTFLATEQTGEVGAAPAPGTAAPVHKASELISAPKLINQQPFDDPTDPGVVDFNGNSDTTLTESMILDVMERTYDEGSYPSVMLIAPILANTVASFATPTGSGISRQLVNDTSTLTAVVDVIRTPFGTLSMTLDRFTNPKDVWLLDMEYWKKSILRPTVLSPLAKTGSSVRMFVENELTLQLSAKNGSGLIRNCVP